MRAWIVYAFLTLLAWGVWGFFSKLASGYTRPRQTLIFQTAGVMAFGLITIRKSGLEGLPLAQRCSPKWEIEPLRWLVVRYMQSAFLRIDEAAEAGRARPLDAKVAEYLGQH